MTKTQLALLSLALAAISLAAGPVQASEELAKKHGCAACHAPAKKVVGPSWHDVAGKYKGTAGAVDSLAEKVKAGGKGVWGNVAMPPQAKVGDADLKAILSWALGQ
jgi:cytochrome c